MLFDFVITEIKVGIMDLQSTDSEWLIDFPKATQLKFISVSESKYYAHSQAFGLWNQKDLDLNFRSACQELHCIREPLKTF